MYIYSIHILIIHIGSGWWFGTCFIFPYIGNVIIPIDELIFLRGVGLNHQPEIIWYNSYHIVMLFYRHILTTICRTSCWTWAPARVVWCWRPLWLAPFCALEVTAGGSDFTIQKWLVFLWGTMGKKRTSAMYFGDFTILHGLFTRENGEKCSSPMYWSYIWMVLGCSTRKNAHTTGI